jgi:hypothetical protein
LIVLPGIYFASILLKEYNLLIIEKIFLGYPIVVAFFCALFWIGSLLGTPGLLWFILLPSILGASSFLYSEKKERTEIWTYIVIFYGIVSVLFFIMFTITTSLPDIDRYGVYYQDSLYIIGITEAVLRSVNPVVDPSFSGLTIGYHMLQNIFYAGISSITGIKPFFLHMHLMPFYDWFFIVGIIFVSTKRFMNLSSRESCILMILIFCAAGSHLYAIAGYHAHLYYNPLSLFFGFSSFILLFILIVNYLQNNSLPVVYTTIISGLVFSSKAIFILIYPLVLVLLIPINWIYRKKISFPTIVLAAGMITMIFLLKFSIYSSICGGEITFNILEMPTPFFAALFEKFPFNIPPEMASLIFLICKFVGFLIYVLLFNWFSIVFILFFLLSDKFRFFIYPYWQQILFIFLFIFISTCLVSSIDWAGGKVYFKWYSTLLTIFLMFYVIQFLFNSTNKSYHKITCCGIIVSIFFFGTYMIQRFMNPWWQTSVMHKKIWDDRASIDNNEWAAMMWIRNNTSSDALFITDRRGFFHESRGEFVSRFYGYSAISGRQFYCEGGEFGSIALADERESRWQTVNNLIYAKSSDKAKAIHQMHLLNLLLKFLKMIQSLFMLKI